MKLEDIKAIMEVFNSTQTTKLHLQQGDFHLKLEKGEITPKVMPQSLPVVVEQKAPAAPIQQPTQRTEAPKGENIISPMVGTFYRSPSPGAAMFVNEGDKVKKGQTLAIIEAMKIMNEIEAEFDCQIIDIVPSDGEPVEYGSPLFIVEKL